jgi:hypothetical protein
LAHELTHVIQQNRNVNTNTINNRTTNQSSDVIYRQEDDKVDETQRVANLKTNYQAAVKRKDWPEAASLLNGFNDRDIESMLEKLSTDQLKSMMQGAQESMPGWSDRVVEPVRGHHHFEAWSRDF